MCPYCLTDELVQHCSINNEIREYKCNICIGTSINVSDVSSAPAAGPTSVHAVVGGAGARARPRAGYQVAAPTPAPAAAVNITSTHTREHMGNICGHCIKPFKWYNKKTRMFKLS